jgi:acetyl esterase
VLKTLRSLPEPVLRRILGPPIVSSEGAVLGLEAQILLWAAALIRRPEVSDVGEVRARKEIEASSAIVDYVKIRVRSEDRTIPGPRGPIPVRIIEPWAPAPRRPVIVYFHGGGWVIGSIESHDGVCRALATKVDAIVVSVGYALAPEHPFPAGLEDAVAATRWSIASAASFGGDAARVAVAGDSAGGNLAAEVALETRHDATRPVFQLLVYPATDLTRSHPSHAIFREGFMLNERSILWFLSKYLTDSKDETNPRASPLFAPAPDLRGLPPALVLTAGFDPLRDEGRAYAEKMKAAGVAVEYRCVEGTIHGFFSFGGVFEHASRAVDDAARALREGLARRR